MTSGDYSPQLFISYSHLDESFKEELQMHLEGRPPGHRIEWWSDSRVPPGGEWNAEIENAVNRSSIAICLVSENFFGSKFIRDCELPYLLKRAQEKRLRIIPIIVRASAFKASVLAEYQAWPDPRTPLVDMTDGQRGAFWERTIDEVEKQLAAVVPERWASDPGLLRLGGSRIAFFPLADFHAQPLEHPEVEVVKETVQYPIDPAALSIPLPTGFRDEPSCRMVRFSRVETGRQRLCVTFAPTSYGDYLRSAALLSQPFPRDITRTFRDEFVRTLPSSPEFTGIELSNICGVGLFVVTEDGFVLISKHSSQSHVYPERWTFTASGTCKWGLHPDPYLEVVRRVYAEIGHQVNLANLRLWGLAARGATPQNPASAVSRRRKNKGVIARAQAT